MKLALFLFLVILTAGCATVVREEISVIEPTAEPTDIGLRIIDYSFAPPELTIVKGSTVTWTNEDAVQHSIVSDSGLFESDLFSKGETFSHTFDAVGEYSYTCRLHPSMTATVIVVD